MLSLHKCRRPGSATSRKVTPVDTAPQRCLALPIGMGLESRELLRLVVHAEEAEIDGITCGEFAEDSAPALLGAAAQITERISLTTTVISALTRSPALLAMTAATLSNLSHGRFSLGLGAGSEIVAAYHQRSFEHPVSAMEDRIAEIRLGLAGEPLLAWGRFRLRRPLGHAVPLFCAAMNRRMLEAAGRSADGVILNLAGPSQIRAQVERGRAARVAAGVSAPWEVAAPLWVDASGDEQRAREKFQLDMSPYLAVGTYRAAMVALSDEDAVDRGAAIWRQKGRVAAAQAFPASIVDALVATSRSTVRERIDEFGAAGATRILLTPLMHDTTRIDDAVAVTDMIAG